nr:embryo-specific protein ATS3A-like [Coffea arabica]
MNRVWRASFFACQWLAFVLQTLMILTGEIAAETSKEKSNCTYAVTIETSCTKGAETSDHVSLRFGDVKSNDILVRHLNSKHVRWVDPLEPQVLDDVPRKPFQACMVDEFQVRGPCVESPICYLYLKLSGNDDWRPGFAQVQVLEASSHLSSDYFYFRRYLPRDAWYGLDVCDTEVTPSGIKYRRKVFANKEKSAQIT